MQHEDDGVEGWMCKNFNFSGPYVTVKKEEGREKVAKFVSTICRDFCVGSDGPDSLSEARLVYR